MRTRWATTLLAIATLEAGCPDDDGESRSEDPARDDPEDVAAAAAGPAESAPPVTITEARISES